MMAMRLQLYVQNHLSFEPKPAESYTQPKVERSEIRQLLVVPAQAQGTATSSMGHEGPEAQSLGAGRVRGWGGLGKEDW